MKCLDKKRIKMKQGETLAINERIMLSLVSTGVCSTNTLSSFSNTKYDNIHEGYKNIALKGTKKPTEAFSSLK